MSRAKISLLLVVASALVAGCGGSSDPVQDPADDSFVPATPKELAGRTFTSVSVTGRDLAPDSQITFEFTADNLGFRAGCNSNLGRYQIRRGNLKFFPGPSTLMACPDELMAQDDWVRTFLEGGADVFLDEGRLSISGADEVVIEMEEAAALPQS